MFNIPIIPIQNYEINNKTFIIHFIKYIKLVLPTNKFDLQTLCIYNTCYCLYSFGIILIKTFRPITYLYELIVFM